MTCTFPIIPDFCVDITEQKQKRFRMLGLGDLGYNVHAISRAFRKARDRLLIRNI